MNNLEEEKLDDLIRAKIGVLAKTRYLIEPSAGFTGKVMARINHINRKRRWAGYLLTVFISMAPLAIREIWMLMRGNYFSVSSWPMGRFIVEMYRFFVSPAALYVLFTLGVLAFILRANKLRRNLNYDFIKIA